MQIKKIALYQRNGHVLWMVKELDTERNDDGHRQRVEKQFLVHY